MVNQKKHPMYNFSEKYMISVWIIYGVLNSDGKGDITDIGIFSLFLVGDKTLNSVQQITGDIDHDGTIELTDLAKLRQYVSKIIESLDS